MCDFSGEFEVVVMDAAYDEWRSYLEESDNPERLNERVDVMDPVIIRDIIRNAHKSLVDIGMAVIKSLYSKTYECISERTRIEANITIDTYNSFAASLLKNAKIIDIQLDHFEMLYNQYLVKLQNAKLFSKSIGGVAIGGAIGSLFGPIGTILGGFAGGALQNDKAIEEVRLSMPTIDEAYHKLVYAVHNFLEEMVDIMVKNIEVYERSIGFEFVYR